MDKDIMKNDKVFEDILQEFSAMREKSQISYVWKEVHNRYGIDIDVWLGDKLRSLTKPTTDIDEVRKIFEETFTATNEDTADLYDDIWNFFEPYLKGGE